MFRRRDQERAAGAWKVSDSAADRAILTLRLYDQGLSGALLTSTSLRASTEAGFMR